MKPAFFVPSANGFTPTELPVSPWNPAAMNGVAVAGLLAHLVETAAPTTSQPMAFGRLTFDFLGPIPFAELTPAFRVLRDGRNVQILEAEMLHAGRVCARAQALRVRVAETVSYEIPTQAPNPESLPRVLGATLGVLIHADRRFVAGPDRLSGPGSAWIKFDFELIAGTALTPLVRAAMLSDFPGGVGNIPQVPRYTRPNLNNVLNLTREPQGEWLLIEAVTESSGNGLGIATATLSDRHSRFGNVSQMLFLS